MLMAKYVRMAQWKIMLSTYDRWAPFVDAAARHAESMPKPKDDFAIRNYRKRKCALRNSSTQGERGKRREPLRDVDVKAPGTLPSAPAAPPSDDEIEVLLERSGLLAGGHALSLLDATKDAAELLGYPAETPEISTIIIAGGHGQSNLWNNCYLSAVLASLASVRSVHAWAVTHTTMHNSVDNCLLCKLGTDVSRLVAPSSEPFVASVTAARASIDPRFSGARQWNVGESLLKLLSACHQVDVNAAQDLLQEDFHTLNDCLLNNMTAAQMGTLALDITLPMFKRFGGVLTSTVWCPCGRTRRKHDITTQLTLRIPDGPSGHSIESALAIWSDWEPLNEKDFNGVWLDSCDSGDQGCGNRGIRFRRVELTAPPEVLAMYINRRLPGAACKDTRTFSYPLTLFLKPSTATYSLRSVIVHSGSRGNSGHYYAICRIGHSWFEFNDAEVKAATAYDATNAEATMLLYEVL